MGRRARRLTAALGTVAALATAGCGGDGNASAGAPVVVVVSAPLSTSPWIGRFVERGAKLAADEINNDGGVKVGDARRRVQVDVVDNAGSPREAVDNARSAVSRGAAVLITDGAGAEGIAAVTDPVKLPVFVTFEGGAQVVDPQQRPTIFRMAPANKPMSIRLADYVAGRHPKVALITDDSSYGRDGRDALRAAFARDEVPVVADVVVPSGTPSLAAQTVRARQAGATLLVVWARAAEVAGTVEAARSAGWQVPVFTAPTGEDPLVRQRLAAHRDWVDGLTFVSFRITSETGPEPFEAYRKKYEKKFGVDRVGVQEGGRDVVQPPDWSMYSYDAVQLTAAALARAHGGKLYDALLSTVITGANGDERGFGPDDREGVSPDDMYFGRFHGFVFEPVKDDILSTGLPPVRQLAGS